MTSQRHRESLSNSLYHNIHTRSKKNSLQIFDHFRNDGGAEVKDVAFRPFAATLQLHRNWQDVRSMMVRVSPLVSSEQSYCDLRKTPFKLDCAGFRFSDPGELFIKSHNIVSTIGKNWILLVFSEMLHRMAFRRS